MGPLVTADLSMYKGKRVLVTGDTGFKGSWLCLLLRELGASVNGFALLPESSDDHFVVTGLDKFIKHGTGDIRDLARVSGFFRETDPEVVFHLAAQPLVRISYDQPKLTFDTNVGGSVNILEAVRMTSSVRSFIYVTSDKCYRNREWPWGYRENDELGGRDPYSASKAAAELVFSSYQDSFFTRRPEFGAASVRAGNVIGGGDWSQDRIVPDCINALRSGRPILLRNPSATRPWQHVLDPLRGYLELGAALLADPARYAGPWNFGPDDTSIRTVRQLADAVCASWGSGSVLTDEKADQPHEATLLHLNCDKARQKLQWRPRWDFDTAVSETVHWYRDVTDGKPAMETSLRQIRTYLEAL